MIEFWIQELRFIPLHTKKSYVVGDFGKVYLAYGLVLDVVGLGNEIGRASCRERV